MLTIDLVRSQFLVAASLVASSCSPTHTRMALPMIETVNISKPRIREVWLHGY